MAMYENFARVYDAFMDDVPYEEWSRYVVRMLKNEGIRDGLILDLGCGTGSMTELLARVGYDMIGVDNSADMLEIALEKREKSGLDILYLLQDMREFELYGTVRAVISVCDSVNYITDESDLLQVFRLVNNYLDPGGIFLFDLKTVHSYRDLMGDSVFAENRERGSFIWENCYYEEERLNEYGLTLFVEEEDGLYRKFEETHYQRAYEPEAIRALIEKAGMELAAVYDAYTMEPPGENSERLCFVAREKHQEGKYYTHEKERG